jgi:adenine phosphoribosyltransferase
MSINLDDFIHKIPNFPKEGILFYDINPIFLDQKLWSYTIEQLAFKLKDIQFDLLIGIESRGFLLVSALALHLNVPFSIIRKAGKLPGSVISQSYGLEYGSDCLEIQSNALKKNQKVILIDDVLATGGTINASITLCHKINVEVVASLFLIELLALNGSKNINSKSISLLQY